MMTLRYAAFSTLFFLGACGTISDVFSRINPFDNEPEAAAEQAQTTQDSAPVTITDGSKLAPTVSLARLETTLSGVIVRADAILPELGYHSAYLQTLTRNGPDGNGVIWYAFRASPPEIVQPGGSDYARQLSAARFIPNSQVQRALAVTITGLHNEVTIRLR